ncbi:MAG: ABC transporter permease [Chitinophagaceae bacterium]|nr:MAG: ABC transporter permease [Chitinophagaceae bacterium]
MIRNYLKIGWRNLTKNKVFSLINVLGLTIGITVCLMIFLFIMNEFSVDKFHKERKDIYRVMRVFGEKDEIPYLSFPYAPALAVDFPGEIKQTVRVMSTNGLVTLADKSSFDEKKLFVADEGFFTLFSFPLLKGDPATVLKDPSGIVLTQKTAKKYFGDKDPMGQVVQVDKERQFRVTGIAQDVPVNSTLDFEVVIPASIYQNESWASLWINNNSFTYVRLADAASAGRLKAGFPRFIDKHLSDLQAKTGLKFGLNIRPMEDIYFEPHSTFDSVRHGDKTIVFIFVSIAILILVIACINFMNLSTIRALERSKEVGLRKVMGALRNHLVWQFIGESILLTLVSCVLAVGLLVLLLPMYNQLLGFQLQVGWQSWPVYGFLAGVILVVGFLAGSYPAFVLSAFSPIQALKGKLKLGRAGATLRQGLVVVQFCISVILVTGTIVIMKQMDYVKSKSLGYDKEHTVLVKIDNNNLYDNRYSFRNELLALPSVTSVSMSSGEPGGYFDMHTFQAEGQQDVFKARTSFGDFSYVKTYGLKIIAGRDFSSDFSTDTLEAVLVNRTAASRLGFTPAEAIGKQISNSMRDSLQRRIVGVVEDFNFLSLKENMDALVISPSDDMRVVAIKLRPGSVNAALPLIRAAYEKAAPSYPLDYHFLDQQFDEVYQADVRQQKILSIFSGLAIFIACLGLFGLASFTANKRMKEIGVRKVLGSTTSNIVLLLSRDLLKPVIIATALSLPVAWYAMDRWLQNFAYRTPVNWTVFALSAFVIFFIAIATVSFKAIRAALMNPVRSLRSE